MLSINIIFCNHQQERNLSVALTLGRDASCCALCKISEYVEKASSGVMKGLSVVAGAERFGILIEEKPGCILTKDWSFRLPLCVWDPAQMSQCWEASGI